VYGRGVFHADGNSGECVNGSKEETDGKLGKRRELYKRDEKGTLTLSVKITG
jgi:hypothetical protein